MQVLAIECTRGIVAVPIPMVAQVIGRIGLADTRSTLPSVRSVIVWREYRIPLVYTSELFGEKAGADDDFSRAVVIWPMQGQGPTDMFALSSLASPRVLQVSESCEFVTPETVFQPSVPDSQSVLEEYSLGFIQVEENAVIVPDLAKLSRTLF